MCIESLRAGKARRTLSDVDVTVNMSSTPNAVDYSVVIVNYNTRDLLRACLASVFGSSGDVTLEVLVVDNKSDDGSPDSVRREFPRALLIANQENAGFSKACNQGISASRGRYILLLNSDTEVFPDTFSNLKRFLDKQPSDQAIGVIGCKILNSDGSLQYSVGRFPSLFATAADICRPPHERKFILHGYDDAHEVDWVTGAFFLIDRQVIRDIGLLDENFFMYYEEVDWCLRAKKSGWKVVYCPYAAITHKTPLASKRNEMSVGLAIEIRRSHLYYYRKNHRFMSYVALSSATLAFLALRWLRWWVVPLGTSATRRRNREMSRALLASVWKTCLALSARKACSP
jgi:GT2 family glycosyltransferase